MARSTLAVRAFQAFVPSQGGAYAGPPRASLGIATPRWIFRRGSITLYEAKHTPVLYSYDQPMTEQLLLSRIAVRLGDGLHAATSRLPLPALHFGYSVPRSSDGKDVTVVCSTV